MSRVLVLGNRGVDMVLRVPRLLRPGETLVAGDLTRAPGGKGLNQAVAAARAGAETWFLAPIGDDPDGRFVAGHLAAEAFASLRLAAVPHATDISVILVGTDAENSIVTAGPRRTASTRRSGPPRSRSAVPAPMPRCRGATS